MSICEENTIQLQTMPENLKSLREEKIGQLKNCHEYRELAQMPFCMLKPMVLLDLNLFLFYAAFMA